MGSRRSTNAATPFVGVGGGHGDVLGHRLLGEGRAPDRDSSDAVDQPLGEGDGPGRRRGQTRRPTRRSAASSSLGRHDLVDQAERCGVGGGQVVAEEQQLLGLLHADQAGEQVGAAAVGDDAAAHEHLDELGGVGGDDEVAGEREVGADAGGGAVDRGDHRLLAVEHGGDEPLGAVADRSGDVAGGAQPARRRDGRRPAARPAGRRRCRSASPVAVMTTARTARCALAVVEQLDHPVALIGRDRVGGVGSVERDPGDTAIDAVEQIVHLIRRLIVSTVPRRGRRGRRPLAPGPNDERVDVELGELVRRGRGRGVCTFMITSTRASTSAAGRPRTPSSRAAPRSSRDHAARLGSVERRHAEGDVAEHLDEHAAEADHDRRVRTARPATARPPPRRRR